MKTKITNLVARVVILGILVVLGNTSLAAVRPDMTKVIQNCYIASFNANPSHINLGGFSTLSWSTSNCTSVNISNIGNVPTSGSLAVYPTYTTTYVLTAYGSNGGEQVQDVTVSVS
jgi:hypothetical protein